jgi:uncharacterized membrane protein YkvA (DUF1232 family)
VFVNPFIGWEEGNRAVGALRESAGEIDPGRIDMSILPQVAPTGNGRAAKVGFRNRNRTTGTVCDDHPVDVVGALAAFVVALLVLWGIALLVLWFHRPTRELAGPALRLLPDVLRLIRRLLTDPATPPSVRVALVALGAWIASPIDLVPEFIPVLGPLDDLVVAAFVLRWVGRRVGIERLRELWPGDAAGFAVLLRLLRLG